MPGRESFTVGTNKYLKNANYALCLGGDLYACAFRERLILGPIDFDDGEAKFSKKAVIVPASAYYELVNALHKGAESFGSGSQEKWEQTIYKHSKAHHVVCKYDYPDEEADYGIHVAIAIKWFYKNDRSFKRLVEDGVREAIDTSKITGDSHYLRRGCYMDVEQLSILLTNLPTLMESSYYETDSKKHVLDLVNYAMGSTKLRDFLKTKLVDYDGMSYQSKIKILKNLLSQMF